MAQKKWHAGKKTYAALAGAITSLILAAAARRGVDLGPLGPEILEVVTIAMLGLAAWARKASKPGD